MTPGLWGAVLGAGAGLGLLLVARAVAAIRRTELELRVLPYLRDVPAFDVLGPARGGADPWTRTVRRLAGLTERLLGGGAVLDRRLERAGLGISVHEYRIEQVTWGLCGFGVVAAYELVHQLGHHTQAGGVVGAVVLCAAGFALGMVCRDSRLTTQVRDRERRILEEFPATAELLALAIGAGESPAAALDRVVQHSSGALAQDLSRVLAQIRTGTPVGSAFDALAARTGLPLVARFASGIATAVDRGTPLADVLHAQAADVREAGRRELIELVARKEVFMLVPIVFLVLPTVVLFAFFPGLASLHLSAN